MERSDHCRILFPDGLTKEIFRRLPKSHSARDGRKSKGSKGRASTYKMDMSSRSREEILHRIRQGLSSVKDPAPMRSETIDFNTEAQRIKKGLVKSKKSLVKQFKIEVESVNSTVLLPNKPESIYQVVHEIISANNLKSFSIWETKYLKQLDLKNQLKNEGLKLITAKNKNRLAGAEIGITEADYAIADTGTLVLLTDKDRPRGVSLLPPIHLAIVKPETTAGEHA